MFTVDRAKLEQAESNGSLLANLWPPGFEDGGRHELAKCDEMTLYELYRPGGEQEVVLASEIERIFLRFRFRINDTYDAEGWERKDRDRRFSLAVAMKRLHHFTMQRHRKGETSGAVQVAQALAANFGEELDRALNSDNVKAASRRLGDMVREAVKALARAEGKLPDMRSSKTLPAPAALILEAKKCSQTCERFPRLKHSYLPCAGEDIATWAKTRRGNGRKFFRRRV
jgi:hypothetical protein